MSITTKKLIDLDLLREVLHYNPDTGELTWKNNKLSRNIIPNTRAGNLHKTAGYRQIMLKGVHYHEHRLIWYLQTGEYPTGVIDHINHIKDDNRWQNLRHVSIADNMRNQSKIKGTITGEQGIWYCKRRRRYIAELTYNKRKVLQRSFINYEDAVQARAEKLAEYGFHENHGK